MRSVVSEGFPEAAVVEANSYQEVLEVVARNPAIDLILLDLNMPGMNDFAGFVSLRNAAPATPVVVVTADERPEIVEEARTCGAAGYINKSLHRSTMIEALQQVSGGALYFPEVDAVEQPAAGDESIGSAMTDLTSQQTRVLDMVAKGLSNKVIAYELGVTESTIKAHVSAILRKLNAHSRTQLAIIYRNLT